MDQLSTALDHVVKVVEDGGLGGLDDLALVGFMQRFERVRNRMPLVDHCLIGEGESRGLQATLTQPSMRGVLVSTLRLSPGEASRRVNAAVACGNRVSMLGEVLEPVRPVLAAAQRDGAVSPEQVQIITSALGKVDRPGFDPAAVTLGEELLTEFATTMGCKDLRLLAEQVVDRIDPDGTLPDEKVNQDRRHLDLKQCPDGMWSGEFRLTGECGAKLHSLLQALSKPRVDPADKTVVDDRTFGQRQHDALEEVCDRVLRAGDVVGTGGTPATVIITITLQDLLDKLGYGTTSNGTIIPVRDVIRMATEAEIIPTVMDGKGAVLNLSRTRRIASHSQTLALIARDKGCSFPGCGRTPEWCERHHIKDWARGGLTDLNNLTLLCRWHHHNFAQRGWQCRMRDDGLPEWIPPKWVDREQKPLQNSRVIAHLTADKQRRNARE
ncbi:MAG: DUF222 domain-containing protein [Propionibacteriaceae bacterium]